MPRPTARTLTQSDAVLLHQRLLADDPTAPSDLADAYLEALIAWLAKTNARVPAEVRIEAAEDALLALIRNPHSYSPELPGQTHLILSTLRLLFEDFLQKGDIQGRFVTLAPHALLAGMSLEQGQRQPTQ